MGKRILVDLVEAAIPLDNILYAEKTIVFERFWTHTDTVYRIEVAYDKDSEIDEMMLIEYKDKEVRDTCFRILINALNIISHTPPTAGKEEQPYELITMDTSE